MSANNLTWRYPSEKLIDNNLSVILHTNFVYTEIKDNIRTINVFYSINPLTAQACYQQFFSVALWSVKLHD